MRVEVDEKVVSGKRENVLETLRAHGALNTSELSEKSEIPTGSRGHHLGQLEDADLIKQTGEETTESGNTAPVWELTDAGDSVAEHVAGKDVSEKDMEELRQMVKDLQSEVEELRQQNQCREDEVKALVATLEEQGLNVEDTYTELVDQRLC